uniref:Uncharacterized protein n=1 Tax=Panagrolaimus superbus TaxID=310955 RepID=A0A914ZCT4_9BILA
MFIWDHSINGDQTGLFSILTNNMPENIIRSSTNLEQLVKVINIKLMPDFQTIACGNSPPIPSNPVSPIAVPTLPPSCFPATVMPTTTMVSAMAYF